MDSWQGYATIISIALAFVAMVVCNLTADLALLGAATALLLLGVLGPADLLAGFANPGLATVVLLFIIAAAMGRTGAVSWIAGLVLGRPRSTLAAQCRLMAPVGLASSVLNNTPVVSAMIPEVQRWARRLGLPLSQLMLPLSYAAIVGGLCTLVGTSTNLVINSMFQESGGTGLALFELAAIGVPALLTTMLFVALLSRWLLDSSVDHSHPFDNPGKYIVEMIVEEGSSMAGQTVSEAGLRQLGDVDLVEIIRAGRLFSIISANEIIHVNDRLIFSGDVDSVVDLQQMPGLKAAGEMAFDLSVNRGKHCLVEAVISPQSNYLHSSISESNMQRKLGIAVLAVCRRGALVRRSIGDIEPRPGDLVLLEVPHAFLQQHKHSTEFLMLSELSDKRPPDHRKRPVAITILLAMLAAVGLGFVPVLHAALAAVAALMLCGCISLRDARQSIDTEVVLVIAASIALGTAMANSGVADTLGTLILGICQESQGLSLLLLFAVTALLTAAISNMAAAVLMFPVAQYLSIHTGASLEPFVVTLMVAASASFATPIGYQTNLMVMGPGNYSYGDFLRMGLPLTIILGLLTLVVVPTVWPF